MSRGLFVNALLRETGRPLTPEQAEKFQKFHSEAYLKQVQQVQPLPGATELLFLDEGTSEVGDRYQWTDRFRSSQSGCSRSAIQRARHHPRSGRARTAGSRSFPGGRGKAACRHCELHRCRRQRLGSACRTESAGFGSGSSIRRLWANWSAPEVIASTRIRTTCRSIWTNSGCELPPDIALGRLALFVDLDG